MNSQKSHLFFSRGGEYAGTLLDVWLLFCIKQKNIELSGGVKMPKFWLATMEMERRPKFQYLDNLRCRFAQGVAYLIVVKVYFALLFLPFLGDGGC